MTMHFNGRMVSLDKAMVFKDPPCERSLVKAKIVHTPMVCIKHGHVKPKMDWKCIHMEEVIGQGIGLQAISKVIAWKCIHMPFQWVSI